MNTTAVLFLRAPLSGPVTKGAGLLKKLSHCGGKGLKNQQYEKRETLLNLLKIV